MTTSFHQYDKHAKVLQLTEPPKCAAVQPKLKIAKVKMENNAEERNKATATVTSVNAMNFLPRLTIQEMSHTRS